MKMKYLALIFCLFASAAGAQQLVNCAPLTPCTLAGPSNTGTGDQAWYAFGKVNTDILTIWGTTFTSSDSSVTFGGTFGSGITAEVNTVPASKLTGNIPFANLPPFTGNAAYAAACQGNVTTSGAAFIDNINVPNGDVVFLGHQTTSSQNGPWVVNSSGAWTRPTWYPSGSTTAAVIGMTIVVAPGTNTSVCGGQMYQLLFANGVAQNPVTIDTSSTSWYETVNYSLAANGATILRSDNAHWADVANVADFGLWSGTLRKNYGNANTVGVTCTAGSTSVTLSSVSIPSSYSGANIFLPGCGNPGAVNSANPGNPAQTFSFAAGGTGFVPQQILNCSGGTAVTACQAIVYSTVLTAQPTITSGGATCTNGTQTFTGTTGVAGSTGTSYFTVTGTVSGNALTSISSYVANGPYTENPVNLAAEPVSGGGCGTAPTLNLSSVMGASTGSIYTAGSYTAIPTNPVTLTPATLPISSMSWASTSGGTVTVTISTYGVGTAAVLPGWMYPGWTTGTSTFPVTIAGATPSGYNGTYTATVTGGSSFTFPLASNPGTETVPGTYQVAPSASGATANLSWYGNPIVGTISGISGGTFTLSTPAVSSVTTGGGKVYLWKTTDTAAFTAAIASGAQTIIVPAPPFVSGWESGYMLSSGITLSGIHRWAFDCMGNFISGADEVAAPVGGSMLTISQASSFRDQAASTVERCDFDAAGGFQRNLTLLDWDWIIDRDLFENATVLNIGWSYGGHSRESRLSNSYIINDGYSPMTYPVEGIDSEASDTRIMNLGIMQGFQQTALFNNSSTGDVNVTDIHAEQVVGGPIFTEKGAGNRWLGGNQADTPAPGFPGFLFSGGYNTAVGNDTLISGYAGQLGILAASSSVHGIYSNNTPNRGGIPVAYTCVDQSSSGSGALNIWRDNQGCAGLGTPVALPSFTVSTLPSCSSVNNTYAMAAVTDASSPTYNATLTGGSTTKVPVFCNGTAWTAH